MLALSSRSGRQKEAVDTSAPAVRCVGLTKRFDTASAVVDATFELPRGSLMALLGPSGGGKTTTLRLIAGFEIPDAGVIEVEGIVVAGAGRQVPPEQRRVGMVFQDYALFPHLSVRDNVGFGVRASADREKRVSEVLEMVGLGAEAARMPNELSGGQQQRVALARALAPNPAVVLLDEPFSNLDAALRDIVRNEVRQILHEAGASALFVTHDQDEAFGLADRVGIMLGSKVVQTGTPEEVYTNPGSLEVAKFLGEENVLDGIASDGYVTCELGRLRIGATEAADGPVKIAVRPESLRLHPEEGPTVSAEVVGREFRGIYKLIKVRLDSGTQLSSVMGLHIPVAVGDRVEIAVNSTVSAFSA